LTIFVLSVLGRHYCRKLGHPVYGFNINIAMIPVFYFFAFRKKHLDKSLDSVTRRYLYIHFLFSKITFICNSFTCLLVIYNFNLQFLYEFFYIFKSRPSFNDVMEFYPITRRAWKRALLIREREMEEIKSKVEKI